MKQLDKYNHIARNGTESANQIALFAWAADNREEYPMLEIMHHIPNGGHRNKSTANRLRLEGVRAGVPDIFLPFPSKGFHGLYIELKAPNMRPQTVWEPRDEVGSIGGLSPSQKAMAIKLFDCGYDWYVCYGWEEAANTIINYLEI